MDAFKKKITQEKGEAKAKQFMAYAAGFFANCGNYRSQGDTKFIPDLAYDDLVEIIQASNNYDQNKDLIDFLLEEVKGPMYSKEGRFSKIGLPPFEGRNY